MCNCDDNINSTEISSGPQGPKGDTGDTPIITGTSTSNLSIGTGSTTFTTQAGIVWVLGQRIRASNSNGTKVMEGPITSYSSTSLVLNVDRTIGSGSNSSWNLSICGEIGLTGSTGSTGSTGPQGGQGVNSYTILNGSTTISSTTYSLNVADTSWMGVGQILYIENSGYYKVVTISTPTDVIVLDLAYTGNTGTFTTNSIISPGGVSGKNGFLYETVDGNGIAATSNTAYDVLVRNSTNTGYTFMTATAYKAYLGSLPAVPGGTW